jgi:hypothetical protein
LEFGRRGRGGYFSLNDQKSENLDGIAAVLTSRLYKYHLKNTVITVKYNKKHLHRENIHST